MDSREKLLRDYLKQEKKMSDTNIDYFIREFQALSDMEKSDLIYEAVGKKIYKENPVSIETFVSDPYFLGEIYGGTLFKIWKDLLHEIYPAPFCKRYDEVILSVATRCFGKGTDILMHDGTTKKVEDIIVGDQVMGPDGKPRNVLSLARGKEMMYKVTPRRGGNPFICNASHKLALKWVRQRQTWYKNHGTYLDIEVKDYLKLPEYRKKHLRMYHSEAIEYPKKELLIDPYIMGTHLGDGYSEAMRLITVDPEIRDAWQNFYEEQVDHESYHFSCVEDNKRKTPTWRVAISSNRKGVTSVYRNYINEVVCASGHKRIPHEYLTSTIEDRRALLAGIIDTDGYCDSRCRPHYRSIATKYRDLAEDYATLARSLGMRATVHERNKKLNYKDEIYTSYDVNITGNFDDIPVRLKRKTTDVEAYERDYSITEFKVEEIGVGEYFGFEVDIDHKFLLPDYLVQNNSGKSTVVAISLLYEIYLITCMINPAKVLTGKSTANIVFAVLSKDNSTAVGQVGAEIHKGLSQAPYFNGIVRDKLSFSKLDKDGVQITDNILIKAGSSKATVIGTDLYAGCVDEANAPSPRIAMESLVDVRLDIIKEMRDRRDATYSKAPKRSGILWFTSSPTDEGDVLGELISEAESMGSPDVLVRDNISRWSAREESTENTFDFFLGSDTKDPCIVDETIELRPEEWEKVIQVPNTQEYYSCFTTDPYFAIQNIAGRRTMPETALFNSVAVFEKVFHKENHIFTKDTPVVAIGSSLNLDDYLVDPDYFSHPDKPECFRYIHLDMAYRCDRFGISSVYSDRIKYTSDDGEEIWRRKYYIDFCLGVTSRNKETVDILKVLEFVYKLKEKGYPLKLVTTDNHQGEIARQMMAKRGVKTDYLSMEKSKEQYLNLKNTILTESLEGFKNPALMRELRGLRESQKKIEKGKGYSDDMCDSLAGALWSCSQDRFYKKNNEAISEIIQQTGNMYPSNAANFSSIARNINRASTFNSNSLGFRYHV